LRRVAHGAPCKRRCSDTAILVGIADYGDSPLLLLSLFRLDTFDVASLAALSWSELLGVDCMHKNRKEVPSSPYKASLPHTLSWTECKPGMLSPSFFAQISRLARCFRARCGGD
jgi:hypothetical protein